MLLPRQYTRQPALIRQHEPRAPVRGIHLRRLLERRPPLLAPAERLRVQVLDGSLAIASSENASAAK